MGSTHTPFGVRAFAPNPASVSLTVADPQVKGGGHTNNPNFSSSAGVQISMSRLDAIEYDASTGTVAVGAGNVWDSVYAALEPYGVNVVGGRVSGIGVAGFTLGGGQSKDAVLAG